MSAQPKKKVKAKRRLQGAANASGANPSSGAAGEAEEMKNDSDISFEDSQEDEFEVEDVIQRPDSDDENGDENAAEWEDCDDSSDEEK